MNSVNGTANGTHTLTLEALAAAKQLPLEFLRKQGVSESRGAVLIPYCDADGNELAVKRRTKLRAKDGSFWPAGRSLLAYGINRLHEAWTEDVLYVVEGESDTWTLWFYGLPALGLPGSGAASTIEPDHVKNVSNIYIVKEPDQGGETFLSGITARLAKIGFAGNAFELTMPIGVKDSNDLHCRDPKQFLANFLGRVQEARCLMRAKGDAWEGDARAPILTPDKVGSYAFKPITSAEFARADFRPEWVVRRLFVAGLPGVLGGPKKTLKTSLLIDLAISISMGLPFLGTFEVPHARRVALLSGESGQYTIQETARRICKAKGIDLADADVLWDFDLPQLSNPLDLSELQRGLELNAVRVLLFDPLYLALLAGLGDQSTSASNLYAMGPLLAAVAKACLSVGCTPLLAHHFKLTRANPHDVPDLSDLSYSGIQEFSRQWILLGRRERYEPGSGEHRLWMTAGGSIGHGGLWAVDVDEGQLDENFQGRTWGVDVVSSAEAREAQADAKDEQRRTAKDSRAKADDAELLNMLDAKDKARAGFGTFKLRVALHWSGDRIKQAVARLLDQDIVESVELESTKGNKAKSACEGIRRKSAEAVTSGSSGQEQADECCPLDGTSGQDESP